MKTRYLTFVALIAASAALAHGGVKDPQVKARMDLMGSVKNNMAVLGDTAKGALAFDPDAVEEARAALIENAAAIPAAFKAPATDPKSEALPAIWQNWDDFAAKAADMGRAVASVNVDSLESVQTGMRTIGKTCGACHKLYRMDN